MNHIFAALVNGALVSAAITVAELAGLRLFRRHLNAATRYIIWWVTLAIAVILPFAYVPVPTPARPPREVRIYANRPPVFHPAAIPEPRPLVRATYPVQVQAKRRSWMEWAAIIWVATSLILLLRLAVAFILLERRKRRAQPAQILSWTGRKGVIVGISKEIATPLATGPWHPMILIPERMLASLTKTELDQIGRHEAAHLARRDDYAILLQRLIEAIFVFHPVVRFIARRIDLEREIACDDIAITGTEAPNSYALCLTRVAELAGRGSLAAAGILEERSHLTTRIETLLDKRRNKGTTLMKGKLLLEFAGLAAACWIGAQNPAVVAFAQSFPARLTPRLLAQTSKPVETKQQSSPTESHWSGGVAWGEIPADDAAGKRLHFIGYIKTEGVTNGSALLRLTADNALQDTHEHPARGTTAWQRYETDLAIPRDAKSVHVGLALTGNGKAWFDSLLVELDGKPYRNDSLFDFDFESAKDGFQIGGPGYTEELDRAVFHTGQQSLRIESGGSPIPQRPFALASSTFPVEVAAGKRVRFSAYIKTENVRHGRAGLWWRVDGRNQRALEFDNMSTRGATGTSDWTRYQIDLPVSSEAVNINFGLLFSGEGTAWFDSLQVELDGVPYQSDSDFDFDFESEYPRGFFYTGGDNYGVQLDPAVAHTGKQSLRMRYGDAEVEYRQLALPADSVSVDIPVGNLIGKRVRVVGYIKTENVKGYAGLLCKVNRGNAIMRFRESVDRPSGSTDWKRYELVVGVPADATSMSVGARIDGTGTAWIDSLQVEADNVSYTESPGLDLDLETDLTHTGFRTTGDYHAAIDRDIFHTGKQSLRIEKPQ